MWICYKGLLTTNCHWENKPGPSGGDFRGKKSSGVGDIECPQALWAPYKNWNSLCPQLIRKSSIIPSTRFFSPNRKGPTGCLVVPTGICRGYEGPNPSVAPPPLPEGFVTFSIRRGRPSLFHLTSVTGGSASTGQRMYPWIPMGT